MTVLERTERCSCGGDITADPSDEDAVMAAVSEHQRTPRHMVWSAGSQATAPCVGYSGHGCLVMVPIERLRCRWCAARMREMAATFGAAA